MDDFLRKEVEMEFLPTPILRSNAEIESRSESIMCSILLCISSAI